MEERRPGICTTHGWFRQYSSAQGRWMSPDPYDGSYDLSSPQSLNRYSYALNNPLAFVDPSGLEYEEACDEDGNCEVYDDGGGGGGDGGGGGGCLTCGIRPRFPAICMDAGGFLRLDLAPPPLHYQKPRIKRRPGTRTPVLQVLSGRAH